MKKLRFFILLVTTLNFATSKAQVAITIFPQIAKQFSIDDVWKTVIINPTQNSISAYISFQIETGANTNVLTLNTQVINLLPGVNHINATEGASGKWVYGSSESSGTLQSTGKLPFGAYTFCVTVYAASNKSLGSDCVERNVAPLVPPKLLTPSENTSVAVKYPVLSWTSPQPSSMGLTYTLRLTKLEKGQTPAEALLQNPPLLNQSNITTTVLNYPMNAPPLNAGTYVWQVAVNSEGSMIATTDIGSFNVTMPDFIKESVTYPMASKAGKEKFYVSHGVFRFAFNNKSNETALSYKIKSMNKNEELKGLPAITLQPGVNKLQVDLKNNTSLKNGSYYYLEITDKNGGIYKVTYYFMQT